MKAKTLVGILALLCALVVPPAFGFRPYVLEVFIIMFIGIIYASAWNLLAVSGQGSLGHAAFFGLGGYASVIAANLLLSSVGISFHPLITIFLGGVFSAAVGVLIGLTCVRLREWFLAMVTFGFAVIIHTVVPSLGSLTGGHDGLPAAKIFPATIKNYIAYDYYLLLILTVAVFFVVRKVAASKAGLAFEAIRENELEAKVMGIDVPKYKLSAFAVSAFIAGVAGALQIHHFGYITPEVFSADKSFLPIIYCIAGGLFTAAGPMVGAVAITFIDEILKALIPIFKSFLIASFSMVAPDLAVRLDTLSWDYVRVAVIGLILVLTVIFLPKGFISLPEKIRGLSRRF